jgi:hypothetical protein
MADEFPPMWSRQRRRASLLRCPLEAAGEAVRVHVHHRTEVRQRQILIEVRLDMLGHPPQS